MRDAHGMADLEDTHVGTVAACDLLGIDRSTLVRWVQSGRITAALKMPGATGSYLFERAEVERIVAEREEAIRLVGAHRVVGAR